MRIPTLFAVVLLIAGPRLGVAQSAGQCDPTTGKAAPDPLTRAVAALRAPAPPKPAAAPAAARARTRPPVRQVTRRSPASRPVVRPAASAIKRRRAAPRHVVTARRTSTGACRPDSSLTRRLAGQAAHGEVAAELFQAPFGAAPTLATVPAPIVVPDAVAAVSGAGLGTGPLGALGGVGVGAAPGISTGILLGAAATVGAGGAIWKAAQHPASRPEGEGGSGAGTGKVARPIEPPTGRGTDPVIPDQPPTSPTVGDSSGDPGSTTPSSPSSPSDPTSPTPPATDPSPIGPPTLPPGGIFPPLPGDPSSPYDPQPEGVNGEPGTGPGPEQPLAGPNDIFDPHAPGSVVPEPTTGSLLIVGAGVLLVGLRRGRRG